MRLRARGIDLVDVKVGGEDARIEVGDLVDFRHTSGHTGTGRVTGIHVREFRFKVGRQRRQKHPATDAEPYFVIKFTKSNSHGGQNGERVFRLRRIVRKHPQAHAQ